MINSDAERNSRASGNGARPLHHGPDGRFRNPWPASAPQGFVGLLRWTLWERLVRPPAPNPDPVRFPRAAPSFARPRAAPDVLTITWVGHSTLLLQIGGLNVLTDPIWSERASPLRFAGPKRLVPPAVSFDALPPIDVVLVSHNHYDHLDDRSVRRLVAACPGAVWVAPLGVAEFLHQRGARQLRELDWWHASEVGDLTVTCTPAQHFSARGLGDRNRTLWASYAVRSSRHGVYFGADSAYHADFRAIGTRCGPFDAVLMPVGAYEPRWFMRPVHMNAEEAIQAFADLRGAGEPSSRSVFVPIHWGTFRLTDEAPEEPPRRALAAWNELQLPSSDFWLLAHGETRTF